MTPHHEALLQEVLTRNERVHGEGFLGAVLTGSAARGRMSEHSDLDVVVVLTEEAAHGRVTARSPEVDEIPATLAELESPGAFGTADWWYRWTFAWARVLVDRTGGRIRYAAHHRRRRKRCCSTTTGSTAM